MPKHHVPDEVLVEYVAGATAEAVALAVACHLTLCGPCQGRAAALERVAGATLEGAPGAALSPGALERALARLDEPPPVQPEATSPVIAGLPRPLLRYVGAAPAWRRVLPGVKAIDLPLAGGGRSGAAAFRARLVRFQPRLEIPLHDHAGDEYIVVFAGGIEDAGAHFSRGDLCVRHAGDQHVQRILPGEPCLALAVNDRALRPLTTWGRLLKWIARE